MSREGSQLEQAEKKKKLFTQRSLCWKCTHWNLRTLGNNCDVTALIIFGELFVCYLCVCLTFR